MNLLNDIPAGDPKQLVNVIVEIPIGSSTKYEFNPKLGVIVADRFLHTAMTYPFNYGFIPQTLGGDHDALDIVVISSHPVTTGTLIECRVIGMLGTEDEEGEDTKLIAVPKAKVDPGFAEINSIDDLSTHMKDKIKHFYEHYKELESGKWIKVSGWLPKERAQEEVEKGIQRYQVSHSEKE